MQNGDKIVCAWSGKSKNLVTGATYIAKDVQDDKILVEDVYGKVLGTYSKTIFMLQSEVGKLNVD